MKYLRTFAIICTIGLLSSSCVKKENYPDVPVITYNNFFPFCSGTTTDSAYLLVNFTDGNGQIGYPQQQQGAPKDFFVQPFIYNANTNTYDSIVYNKADTSIKFSYLIPDITPAGSDKELNGIIQIDIESTDIGDITALSNLLPNGIYYYQLEFKVWMYDRNGNKSNVITTPVVQLCH